MKVMISGVNGFVGKALLKKLIFLNISVRGTVREIFFDCESNIEWAAVGDINGTTDWSLALKDIDVVVHCAARVHIMNDHAVDPLSAFRKTNVDGTLNLSLQAARAGVKRFIFLSTVKVNGESTDIDKMFYEQDIPMPVDPYSISKWEAEQGLRSVSDATGMEIVIIRPPLIYGPDVKGNFQSLMRLAKTGLPLPFGGIQNRRSMLYVENLVDFIVTALDHSAAANETFFLSDNEDLSTKQLLQALRVSMGIPPHIFSIPMSFFYRIGRFSRTSVVVDRLCGSLRVDNSKAKKKLNWTVPFTVYEGLAKTAMYWLKHRNN